MNKMKRLLALVICLLMTITSLPVTQLFASANEGLLANGENVGVFATTPIPSENIVSVDKTFNYTDVDSALADGWSYGLVKNNAFVKNETLNADFVVENGIPTLKQIQQTVTTNNTSASADYGTKVIYKLPAGTVAEEEVNGTRIISEDGKYTGIVTIDVEAEYNGANKDKYTYIHNYTDGNGNPQTSSIIVNPSFHVTDYVGDKTAVQWRIKATSVYALSNTSESASDIFVNGTLSSLGGKAGDTVVISGTIDMVEQTVSATLGETGNGKVATGSTWAKNQKTPGTVNYIDRIEQSQLIRLPVDSYSKIKAVKVTTIDPKFGDETTAVLNQLPATLVNNIDGATELSVTLPAIAGVTWTSEDETVAKVNGNTLNLIPSKTETKDAVVKATFTTDGIKYSKEYKFTLAANECFAVTYYVDNSVYSTVAVNKNEKASAIDAPEKTGMIFDGWFLDGATTAFDFETAVTEDLSLYAKYSVDPNYNLTTDGVVAFSKTFNYTDVDSALADGWSYGLVKNNVFVKNEILNADFVVESGIPALKQMKQTVTTNNTSASADLGTSMEYYFPAGPVAIDTNNRTSVINEDGKYHGNVKVVVDAELDVGPSKAYTHTHTYMDGNTQKTVTITVNPSFSSMNIQGNAIGAQWRIRTTNTQALSHSGEDVSDIKTSKNTNYLGGTPKNGLLMSTTIDTTAETVAAEVPDTGNGLTASGTTWAKHADKKDLTYLNRISLAQMLRLPVDSYSKVKGVTLTTLDPQFGTEATAKLNELPAKLDVNDVNAVTTLEFDLPEIAGVVWISSDDSLLSINGSKVTVNRVKGETKEVTIKATFTADGIKYSKEYAMTLAAGENIVKYYNVSGDLVNSLEVKDGEKASEINAPSVEHYDFVGWYEDGATTAFDFDTTINNHVTLYAKYEAKIYNVIFKADGNTVATLSGKYNDVVKGTIPTVPQKIDYTAIGWFVGDTNEAFGESTLITGPDMVINAKYIEGLLNKYTVSFKVDGVEYATETVFDGYKVTMPEDPTKANYTFVYWTLNGAEFYEDTTITSNITLEAKFNPNPVNVEFYMDEAMTEHFHTGTGYYNTVYGTLPVPSKDMYKFKGWKLADGTDFTADTVVTEEISVYATWEYTVKLILDEDITQYTSRAGNNVEFFDATTSFAESFIDNGYVVKVTKPSPTERSFETLFTAAVKAPIGEYDAENRTQIYNSKFVGDYEIEIIFDSKLSGSYTADDGTSVNAPFGLVSTGSGVGTTGFKPLLANRMYSYRIQSYNSTSDSTNSFNTTGSLGSATTYTYPNAVDGIVKDISLKIRYNTFEAKAYMTVNDSDNVSLGNPMTKLAYINSFYMSTMPCNRIGDFIRIKRVRVTRYNDYSDTEDFAKANEILAELPASVVENPYDAKGALNLPEIRGVKWSSTDETIVDTIAGEIRPWYSDIDVVVKATITSGNFSYEKSYTLTVKGIATETEEIINETFTSEEDLENWSFVNLEDVAVGDYSVDENGVKISKTSPATEPDKKYETSSYFAFYDLYDEVEFSDYTLTEVKDHKGVYDVTIDYSKFSASSLPVNIAVGYRNDNTFYDFGMLKINSQGTYFAYQKTGETRATVLLNVPDSAKLTFRIDNINKEICLFKDGELITTRYSFKTSMGDNARINSVKVELDTNNELGDYVIIKGINVTKVVGNQASEINDIVSASKGIDVYDITATPQSVSGTINNLPATIGGYDVVWSASSNQIDLETGEVFHDTTAKKVYLYAEILDADAVYPYVVRKTFELNVRGAANSAETDKFIINNLGRITNQNYNDIRYDLAIPQVDGITWTSSDTSIIDNNGIINKNKVITTATPVIITATNNSVSKEYKLTVSPRTPLQTVATGTNNVTFKVGSVSNAKVSGNLTASFTYKKGNDGKVNIVDTNDNILVSLVSDDDGFYFDYSGSDYKKYDLATAEIDMVVMPDVDKVAIFVDGVLVADYVSVKFSTDYIAKVEAEFDVGEITLSMDKYGILQSNIDNFDYFADAEIGYANKDGIRLPTTTFTNANVMWTSSNNSILANNGKVTTPNTITNVNLTFNIVDSENPNVVIKKDFVITVDCATDKNLIYKSVPTVEFQNPVYHQSNVTDGDVKTIFKVINANGSDHDIVFNLGDATIFNTMYILQAEANMRGYEIYSSNDGLSWNLVKSGDMSGKCSDLIKITNTTAAYIKLTVKKCDATEINIREIELFFGGSALELAQYDIENVVVDVAPTGTKINLPEVGANGTEFTWTSSNENVIDNKGNITRPSSATTVKLTATVIVAGETVSKVFEVYVDSKTTSGPSQVGGGAGGGGGGGAAGSATSKPVIGTTDDTVYAEPEKEEIVSSESLMYNDVKTTDWYYDAVTTLTEKGVISGDGTGKFNPSDKVTREQFVKMILEAIGVDVEHSFHTFTDVTSGAWYEGYVATAVSKGIVNGIGAGKFGVGSNISRQDMAVLIERVLAYKGFEIEKSEVEPFADISNAADYAKDAVENIKAIGLIQGYDNNYHPKDNLTRAEAATVIVNLLELLAK